MTETTNFQKISVSQTFVKHIKNDKYDFYTVRLPLGAKAINEKTDIGGYSFTLNPELVNPVCLNRVDRSIMLYEIKIDPIRTYKMSRWTLKDGVEPILDENGKRCNPHSDYETIVIYMLGGDIAYGMEESRRKYLEQKSTKTEVR